ncbi:MAG: PEP/pyruvate-binding domain-containing protein [Actinomyces sp.]|nr:PEP/pyruvate-binding domain-containing protein [Actinomyces sp.]
MEAHASASTGIPGLDRTVDGLRAGDNVVWQVDSTADFAEVTLPFVRATLEAGHQVHYVRFSSAPPLVPGLPGVVVHRVDATVGFESFATQVHQLISDTGTTASYVFDSLSDLLELWHSDLMVMNFFAVTCPHLYDLDALAYFCLVRRHHSATTIAGIRETTQLLLELHRIEERLYIHPLKVWARYSPSMFLPHRLDGAEVEPVTSSEESARLFAALGGRAALTDHWAELVERARSTLTGESGDSSERRDAEGEEVPRTSAARSVEAQARARDLLLEVMVGREGRLVDLCRTHLTLTDLLSIAHRLVGTGRIGGKSVGMLVARAILEHDPRARFRANLEAHDSFFLGSDHFYTYVVSNGWWRLRMRQKQAGSFLEAGEQLREHLGLGRFPPAVREDFWRILDHFGQSPFIVRSSSLLEDDYGNAFAGKYDSVFLVNQGSPEDRYRALEEAVRQVYASTMSAEALAYRRARGLEFRDEQMALLVQRVSGDHHGDLFFPDAAGVANSANLYVWSPDIDADAGMARMVVGLGTRAVDRTRKDYARIVALGDPLSTGLAEETDAARFSQRRMDVLSLSGNAQVVLPVAQVAGVDRGPAWPLFLSTDRAAVRRLEELGRPSGAAPQLVDFRGLLADTDFAPWLREVLAVLEAAYDYPVDIEFTLNVTPRGWRFNLLQCRPLQTRGPGLPVEVTEPADPSRCLLTTHGGFMGGNVRLELDHVVLVRPEAYLALGTQDRHEVARRIGDLNRMLEGHNVMYLGPGRWGTTTPGLGVPVSFAEISGATVLGELTYAPGDFHPELSWGSHFFQDLVETGIFYVAVMDDAPGTVFNPERVLARPNRLVELVPEAAPLEGVVHVAAFEALELRSDVVSQRLVCA